MYRCHAAHHSRISGCSHRELSFLRFWMVPFIGPLHDETSATSAFRRSRAAPGAASHSASAILCHPFLRESLTWTQPPAAPAGVGSSVARAMEKTPGPCQQIRALLCGVQREGSCHHCQTTCYSAFMCGAHCRRSAGWRVRANGNAPICTPMSCGARCVPQRHGHCHLLPLMTHGIQGRPAGSRACAFWSDMK